MNAFDGISLKAKVSLGIAGMIMGIFFIVQTCIVFGICESTILLDRFGYACIIGFMPPFFYVVKEFLTNKRLILRQIEQQIKDFKDFQEFVEEASLVSRTDKRGRITFVNKKFEKVSGWKLSEVLGKDHILVNSDLQEPGYWGKMYEKVNQGGVWNDVVTNKRKDGELYYVDTFIKASFDYKGDRTGYSSIRQDVTEIVKSSAELTQKNIYLEHAAKIIRHDMHSGINTYLPRGIKSLKRRLSDEQIDELKISGPLKLIEDGLSHSRKVYEGVYEFTNLVKQNAQMGRTETDVKSSLSEYLRLTAYSNQVILDDNLPKKLLINEPLFCTAVDNLIRNGLKYNDSPTKWVKIYFETDQQHNNCIIIEDNGRGITNEEFIELSKPYVRKEGQKEGGTGLGLNICIEILKEHKFRVEAEKTNTGTKIKISI